MKHVSVKRPNYAPFLVIIVAVAIGLAAVSFKTDRGVVSSKETDSEEAHASGVFPLPVYGYVNDSLGNPVPGALVTVMTISGGAVKATLTNITDAAGFYAVSFDGPQWDVGWTVAANATYEILWANESVLVDAFTVEVFIELEFPVPIPEFSSLLFAVGVAAFVFVFASSCRKRQR